MMWEVLKPETKKARNIVDEVEYCVYAYGYRSIFDAYKNPSSEKEKIWFDWQRFAIDNDADIYTVVRSNPYVFTLAIVFTENGIRKLAYITPNHKYEITLS